MNIIPQTKKADKKLKSRAIQSSDDMKFRNNTYDVDAGNNVISIRNPQMNIRNASSDVLRANDFVVHFEFTHSAKNWAPVSTKPVLRIDGLALSRSTNAGTMLPSDK